jgi:hypothetical protein
MLVPVGCQSGKSGAPFGFIDNITTDHVVEIIRSIPSQQATVADLFSAFGKIGEIEVNINLTKSFLEFAVVKPLRPPVTRFKVYDRGPKVSWAPGVSQSTATPGSLTSPSTDEKFTSAVEDEKFAIAVEAESQAFRPWWNRGVTEAMWQNLDVVPWIYIGFVSWLGFPLAGILYLLTTVKWWYRNASRIRICTNIKRLSTTIYIISPVLILIGLTRLFIYGYGYAIFYVIIVVGIYAKASSERDS